MANKLDEFMAEIKAFDYKWFDEIGGNEALAEIGRLREQASGTTTRAVDLAVCTCTTRPTPNTLQIDPACPTHSPNH